MLIIPGRAGRDTCDGVTRRELLRIGGSAMLGLGLADILQLQQQAKATGGAAAHGPGFGRAEHVILVYLQGGPSHIDLWDPKENVPANVRSPFNAINTRLPGVKFTEVLPRLAQQLDKVTLIRSMSYTPVGLFNHTAAIYQMLTGYQASAVSPSGQLEPPTPSDFPNIGCNIARLKPAAVPMLPFVMMPRPLQESGVVNKGGTAGFLGRAYDPYYLFPAGDDMDMNKMARVNIEDLQLRPELSPNRLQNRGSLLEAINHGMPELEEAVQHFDLDAYYGQALNLIISGRARNAFDLSQENANTRDLYGRNTFGECCLLARRLIEAGTRFVEVNWPKVANSDNHSWDMHEGLTNRMRNQAGPMFDRGLAALIEDLAQRSLLNNTLVVAVGEFGRSPQKGLSTSGNNNSADGRDHWPYCYTACVAGAGVRRGFVYGRSDATGSSPLENPVHPTDLLSTIYHSVGIDPHTLMYNHLNQPRELSQGNVVTGILS